jgi:hypothetical protein
MYNKKVYVLFFLSVSVLNGFRFLRLILHVFILYSSLQRHFPKAGLNFNPGNISHRFHLYSICRPMPTQKMMDYRYSERSQLRRTYSPHAFWSAIHYITLREWELNYNKLRLWFDVHTCCFLINNIGVNLSPAHVIKTHTHTHTHRSIVICLLYLRWPEASPNDKVNLRTGTIQCRVSVTAIRHQFFLA